MSFDKFKKEYIPLVKNFDCGNVVINNFLNSENALDFNQGITYVLLSDDKDFIIGYFNISVGRIDQIEKVMDHTYYIPMGGAININYLAVDKRLQHTLLVPEAKIYYGDLFRIRIRIAKNYINGLMIFLKDRACQMEILGVPCFFTFFQNGDDYIVGT